MLAQNFPVRNPVWNGSNSNLLNLCFAAMSHRALHWATKLIMVAQNFPVRKPGASGTDQIATCSMLHWCLHCASKLSIMVAKLLLLKTHNASGTDQNAPCSISVSHCNVALGLALCNQTFHYGCPNLSVTESRRIRNGSNCNSPVLCFILWFEIRTFILQCKLFMACILPRKPSVTAKPSHQRLRLTNAFRIRPSASTKHLCIVRTWWSYLFPSIKRIDLQPAHSMCLIVIMQSFCNLIYWNIFGTENLAIHDGLTCNLCTLCVLLWECNVFAFSYIQNCSIWNTWPSVTDWLATCALYVLIVMTWSCCILVYSNNFNTENLAICTYWLATSKFCASCRNVHSGLSQPCRYGNCCHQ